MPLLQISLDYVVSWQINMKVKGIKPNDILSKLLTAEKVSNPRPRIIRLKNPQIASSNIVNEANLVNSRNL